MSKGGGTEVADHTAAPRPSRAQAPMSARLPVDWPEGAMSVPAAGHALAEVVILFTDAGGGHRSAARSLAEAMEGRAHVTLLNLLDEHTPFPFNRMSRSYGPCVNYAPRLYSLIYHATESRKPVMLGERYVYPLVRRSLHAALAAPRPTWSSASIRCLRGCRCACCERPAAGRLLSRWSPTRSASTRRGFARVSTCALSRRKRRV